MAESLQECNGSPPFIASIKPNSMINFSVGAISSCAAAKKK